MLAILSVLLPADTSAQEPGRVIQTTAADQRNLAVTIYNSNLGLVRDTRQLNLPAGTFTIRFMDVAAQINPASVLIRSLTQAGGLEVLEQNYEYDLLNPQKLLDKYVGKTLTLVLKQLVNGSEQFINKQATLLANNSGQQVWQIESQIVINPTNIASINFPNLPETLIAHPTLTWNLQNRNAGNQTIEAAYLTGGIGWNADYVVVLDKDEKLADLNGWVTITNQSGGEFRNAQLQLVAGAINRVPDRRQMDMIQESMVTAAPKAPGAFQEEGLLDYHLYTLDRKTTIKNNENKQISLLSGAGLTVAKEYTLVGQPYYFQGYRNPGQPVKEPVGVFISFVNSDKNKLGLPLPAGVVRVYKADSKGGQQFVGEDRIDHTPKDETVRLRLGNAFDIVAERIQRDYRQLAQNLFEYEYEIAIRNRKSEAVTVVVNESIHGEWEILRSTFPATKTSAFSVRFEVPAPANSEAKLTYRVRVKH